jgi:hypothetical protein
VLALLSVLQPDSGIIFTITIESQRMNIAASTPMSHVIVMVIAVSIWLSFVAWTINHFAAKRRKCDPKVFRYGVMWFGMSLWTGSLFLGVISWSGMDANPPIWFKAMYLGLILLPLCLWGGYIWGKVMALILSNSRSK